MENVEWLETADEDLNQIYQYIYKDSIYYANKTIIDIVDKTDILKTFKHSGRKVPEYNQEEIRELIYKSYRIVYYIQSDKILIQRIWHAARKMHNRVIS